MAFGPVRPTLRGKGSRYERSRDMRKAFEIGGFIAAAVLIVFGVVAIVMGVNGRSTVHSSLKLEAITGSADMNPAAIATEAKAAGLPSTLALPSCSVAG